MDVANISALLSKSEALELLKCEGMLRAPQGTRG
jgi:hypothetical protein